MIRSLAGKKNSHPADNRGSTLITVIVAIAFVTILTSIILGTTLMNVRMKEIDRRSKGVFYYSEKALNDIYTGLGQDATEIAGEWYEKEFEKIGTKDESAHIDYSQAEKADSEFRQHFLDDVKALVYNSSDDVRKSKLQAYITGSGTVDHVGGVEIQDKDGNACNSTDPQAYRVAINNVRVSVADTSQYESVISTDIIINIPSVDFLGTNMDVSDYGLIANEGLYIEGTNSDKTVITGNVYAGIHNTADSRDDAYAEKTDEFSRKDFYGGIGINGTNAVFNGNSIVTKGDINLTGSNPTLKISLDVDETGNDNRANLWFTSLRTISGKADYTDTPTTSMTKDDAAIYINANVFALNDLQLNADKSSAYIEGNYYGYNDKTLSDKLPGQLGEVAGRDDSKSSAIIINGNKSYLNMEKIDNFVLMGKAYIDFTSDTTNTDATGTANQIVPTAEGVAVKTNQQLYLVPPDFLDGPNPAVGGEPGTVNEVKFELNTSLDGWFGLKYLDYDDTVATPDLSTIHKRYPIKQKGTNTWVYYDYLNFNDKKWKPVYDGLGKITDYVLDTSGADLGTGGSISSQQKFFYDIMKATYDATKETTELQPTAYRLKERIDRSMVNTEYFDLKGCVVGTGAADSHFYSKNAIVKYIRSGTTEITSNVMENKDGMYRYIKYPQNLFRRYKWLCTKLDGKEDIPLDKIGDTDLPDIPASDLAEWSDPSKRAPIKHFVKLSAVDANDELADCKMGEAENYPALIKSGAFGVCIAINLRDPADPEGTVGTLNLGDSSIPKISSTTFKGIAIVDGDIIVPKNINVDGLLMATGKIILQGNNKIRFNKGLIQSRIEKEVNLIKNDPGDPDDATYDAYKPYYLISYLSKDNGTDLLYDIVPGTAIQRDAIEVDYYDFMHYENWQKGKQLESE